MNDFECKRLGPSHSELLMAREDTFVDGTDDTSPKVTDVTLDYSFAELVDAASGGLLDTFDAVAINAGTLRYLVWEYKKLRETVGKIYELLEG